MSEVVSVNVKLTRKELEAFDRAVKQSKRFLNRSDALRQLIRDFIESVEEGEKKTVFIDADADCEVISQ